MPLLWRSESRQALKGVAASRTADYNAAVRELSVHVTRRPLLSSRRDRRPAQKAPWTLPLVHKLSCVYGTLSQGNAAPRMCAWIARFGAQLTAVTIAFDLDAPPPR